MTDTTGKKDTQKLQRAIVDALEDVKAQDIQVFNTEHLSPLFERVIMASGTSNRQTRALAASVRDKVREAGFPKPRIEGEDNGEWIIVDCGAAVAHVMQPSIRQYYNLEEIWGDKPVRLKFGAPKPAVKVEAPMAKKAAAKTTRAAAGTRAKTPTSTPTKAPARRVTAKTTGSASTRSVGAGKAGDKLARSAVKRSPSAVKTPVTKVIVPATARRAPATRATPPAKSARPRRASAKKAAPAKA